MVENDNNEFRYVRQSVIDSPPEAKDFESADELIIIGADTPEDSSVSSNPDQPAGSKKQYEIDIEDLKHPMPKIQLVVFIVAAIAIVVVVINLIRFWL
ncbi:MAG: hypothetical protein LBU61_02980 [Coriobacteriales bacterium]|jgi:hypothetical protein|nr:hypothetical protein [Coriobacteriales bacterium]